MTRFYVERNETWWVDAETELEAQQICRDGGGDGHTVEWWTETGELWILPDDPGKAPLVEVPRD